MLREYTTNIEDLFMELGTDADGLTDSAAADLLKQHGENKLKQAPKPSLAKRFLAQLKDAMLIILIIAAVISAVTSIIEGESLADFFIIIVVVLLNAILGVYQESKAEAAIEALQNMTAATSKVLRGGKSVVLPSAELVPGDIVLLEAGDSIPADGRIIEAASLKIEEAALTGESVPVDKVAHVLELGEASDIALGDRINMCYMGSTVVYGRGAMLVTRTGMNTEMGKIANALDQTEDEQTPLQKNLSKLGKTLSILVLVICVFIFAFNLLRAGDYSIDNILATFMVAVSLAVAAIPEGLATVVTVVLSIGVTNMSHKQAVIRRLTAVETLGCAQVICSDKTGTLTQNKMTVVDHAGSASETELATAMAMCSDARLNSDDTIEGEPTEAALVAYAASLGLKKYEMETAAPRIAEAPFDSDRKMMTTIHETANGVVQYTKGAPDVVLALCTSYLEGDVIVPMTEEKRAAIATANKNMADRALRVLAAATRKWDAIPTDIRPAALEKELCFVGLTGMIDPVRPEVKSAIKLCTSAGIRPVMITGDHIDTAVAIAKELGIITSSDQALTGSQLNEIPDDVLDSTIANYGVYARVQPEHKVRIVSAWKKAGCVTAMTGDGVNDAPSIKTADIGVGMGITGTDVTKNVADMVLADDNFATIVSAVGEGRRIYDNIRKAIQFLLASNMSEVLGVFLATVLGFTILKPVHLLFINLLTDTFPALALGLEKAEPGLMDRPPRKSTDGIFSNGLGADVVYQGVLVALIVLCSYVLGHSMEVGYFEIPHGISVQGMSMAFITMNMCEIFHSFNMRSQRHSIFTLKSQNIILWAAMVGSFILCFLVVEVPAIAAVFSLTPVSAKEFLIAVVLAFLIIPIVEIVKCFQRLGKRK